MSRPRRASRRASLAATAITASTLAAFVAPQAASAAAGPVSVTSKKLVVTMRGLGHGHGMSQYGARGAALAGKNYQQILDFYYPHTTLRTLHRSAIRVRLSGTGTTLDVLAASRLHVTGVAGALPTAGVRRYRLVANAGTGTSLQQLLVGKGWRTINGALPNGAQLHRTHMSAMRVSTGGGQTVAYSGWLTAVRVNPSGRAGGVFAVNKVSLDQYTAGVVPREMPASWERAAVDAQAVAARTYGQYAVEHPLSTSYDICDTTACQVYGGSAAYNADGSLRSRNFLPAARDTSRQVLTYGGQTIFAQFSASNGGWTVAGGQPYLVAKADPYDNAASGDPYLGYTTTIDASWLARQYGLVSITSVAIARDGHGSGGGRAVSVTIAGTASDGTKKQITTTGGDLAATVGAGTTWLAVRNA